MAKKQTRKRAAKSRRPARAQRTTAAKKVVRKTVVRKSTPQGLFGPIPDAQHHSVGGVEIDVQRAGAARVKRVVYPAGFRWSVNMKPVTGTDRCMHAHVGFLAHGRIHMVYGDGAVVEYQAPQIVAIEPGHDGWVIGRAPAVLIEFDFERQTVERMGLPDTHHARP